MGPKGFKREEVDEDVGQLKLKDFVKKDKTDKIIENQNRDRDVIAQKDFEAAMIDEVQTYIENAAKRLEGRPVPTAQRAMSDIYYRMLAKHGPYIEKNYPLVKYGLRKEQKPKNEDEEAKVIKKGKGKPDFKDRSAKKIGRQDDDDSDYEDVEQDNFEEEAKKAKEALKPVPPKFQTFFRRLIKTVQNKKNMKNFVQRDTGKLDKDQVLKYFRRLPTTFVVVGSANKTHNKKILMTSRLNKFCDYNRFCPKDNEINKQERRNRIFYRPDYKKELTEVFMTTDEQMNCKFEPNCGRLNPFFTQKGEDSGEPFTHKQFVEKHGKNFEKSHPEIFKEGKLK